MKKDNNLLDYVPLIAQQIQWSENEDAIVTVDVVNKGMFNRIAQVCFGRPKVSHIALEEFGSFIWKQIDGKHTIYDIAMFAASLKGVKKLHLLPYHRLGQGKYDGLGREYKLDGIDLIPNEYMQELLEVAKKSGLKCQIGG